MEQLIEKLSNGISSDVIISYLELSNDLMFQDEELLKKCTDTLNGAISKWAKEKSATYSEIRDIFAKRDLEDKSRWYVKEMIPHSHITHTSGSTTGQPFEYLWYMPVFNKIEWENHYDMVLDEFDIGDAPHILYFLPHSYEVEGEKFIFCPGVKSHLNFVNHGSTRNPVIHHVNFEMHRQRPEEFFEFLFEYLKSHQIDVFYASPPQINSLCSHIRRFGLKDRVGYLLSTTGERLLPEDAIFLLDGGYFDHICDHMRCWDGGATFFTCKHKNYHLMDNLAWCEEGPNHELICTDYFNLASPFVRYWNGDYCKIAKEYQRCECGRLYRDFEFLESRPFALKGTNMREIQEKIKALAMGGIKQVRCSAHDLSVISTRNLTDEEKNRIQSVSEKFKFKFLCEPF
ncbi:hypothetical protein EBZ39_03940 [bacterium]|nr:hypothetical protein [bacterium]